MTLMKAMQLEKAGQALNLVNIPIPTPKSHELLIKVSACGICRTDLHILDGELSDPNLPLIPGHQIIGTIVKKGVDVNQFIVGQRIGVPWLGESCGHCDFCYRQQENLCDAARYTGYQINGGFAEYCVANANYCFQIPEDYPDEQAAPLLCAGLIGYRAFRKVSHAKNLGLIGFGSAAHILTQIANYYQIATYAFTKKSDQTTQTFAKSLGAVWAGSIDNPPDTQLDAAIIFAPQGELVPAALKLVRKGGTVITAGIHMSDIPSFPYSILWGERTVSSIANLTKYDGEAFLQLAPKIPIDTMVTIYPLEKANEALNDLRQGNFQGAGVIKI